jgi:putative transposase
MKQFGNDKKDAPKSYRQFVGKGIEDGRKPHLVGGGLIRSMGGWSEVKALRRIGARELYDDRVLGSGDFVKQISEEVDLAKKYRFSATERLGKAMEAIERACTKQQIEIEALRKGSRMGPVSRTRAALAIQLVNEYGLSLAETACQLGV